MYLKRGKYSYLRDGSSEKILNDALIIDMIDFGDYVAVKVDGPYNGSLAVYNRKNILIEKSNRSIIIRNKPCRCVNFGFGQTEWMAGVPIYCKTVYNGAKCPLMKANIENGIQVFFCNYKKARQADYIKLCQINNIHVEKISVSH